MHQRTVRVFFGVLLAGTLTACEPPTPETPRPTAATILEFTPAATQDIDATATSYAQLLIPSPTPAGLYVVQPGDTLSGLAEDFGTTVEEIMAANGLTDPNALQVGQPLIIPSLISRPLATASPLSPTVPTPTPTDEPTLPPTRVPPTSTALPPSETPVPPTETGIPAPPTETQIPVPLDATPVPTEAPAVPTETPIPTLSTP